MIKDLTFYTKLKEDKQENFQFLQKLDRSGILWASGHKPSEWVNLDTYLIIKVSSMVLTTSFKFTYFYIDDLNYNYVELNWDDFFKVSYKLSALNKIMSGVGCGVFLELYTGDDYTRIISTEIDLL